MKERPILFSAPMVRALLAGQKTQTRRLVTPQPRANHYLQPMWGTSPPPDPVEFGEKHMWREVGPDYPDDTSDDRRCPYGVPGDTLWVRETFRSWRDICDQDEDDDHEHGEHCDQTYVAYAATPRQGYRPKPDRARITYLDESTPLESNRRLLGPWKPGIHMPRWASRLTLAITDVRVERLHEITKTDARAEGVEASMGDPMSCRDAFAALWDSINGKRAPWSSNPWLWVLNVEVRR